MLKNITGSTVPSTTFHTYKNNQWVDVSAEELFANKTVVAFSLPGAYTPTCSLSHLPRYNELAPIFKKNGVNSIVCIAVNDTFVMNEWAEVQAANNVIMAPDGNGEFTESMGMLVDKGAVGLGKRSWRYSMLVKNGTIKKMFIEPEGEGDPFEVSDADTMLNYINPNAVVPEAAFILTRKGCPHCQKARDLLVTHNVYFEEVTLDENITSRTVRAISGQDTTPQVFIGGKHIGGTEKLNNFLQG